jgi:hypothetical protein
VIVYEVRIAVDAAIEGDYRRWLDGHVHEILSLPGFERAELLREDADGERPVFVVRYHLGSRGALEHYLREHAARLRAQGIERFGDRFSASRRVLELTRSY